MAETDVVAGNNTEATIEVRFNPSLPGAVWTAMQHFEDKANMKE
jgi:hypothetical protein